MQPNNNIAPQQPTQPDLTPQLPQNPPQQPQATYSPPVPTQVAPEIAPVAYGQPTQLPNQIAPLPQSSGRNFSKIIKIAAIVIGSFMVIVVLFIVAVFLLVGNKTKDAEKVSNQFVNNLQAGDSDAIYAQTTPSFKKITSSDTNKQFVDTISPAIQGEEKITGRKIQSSAGNKSFTSIVYDIDTAKGTSYLRIVMEKDNDTWKVLNFRASETRLEAIVE